MIQMAQGEQSKRIPRTRLAEGSKGLKQPFQKSHSFRFFVIVVLLEVPLFISFVHYIFTRMSGPSSYHSSGIVDSLTHCRSGHENLFTLIIWKVSGFRVPESPWSQGDGLPYPNYSGSRDSIEHLNCSKTFTRPSSNWTFHTKVVRKDSFHHPQIAQPPSPQKKVPVQFRSFTTFTVEDV